MAAKVCMLVRHHPFLDARIFQKEAKSLVKKGYDVTMIVPRRKGFLYDIDLTPFKDKYLKPSFVHEGVKIVTYNDVVQPIKKMHKNIMTPGFKAFEDPLFKLGVAQQADIYHAHEFLSFYSGVGIKRALKAKGKKVKLIYDSHEIAPDPLEKMQKDKKLLRKQMLLQMLKEVDHVITISEGIKTWYLTQNNKLPIEVIYNSPPLQKLTPKKPNENKFVVCYEGIVHPNRGGMEKIIQITEKCSKKIPGFKFKIIGGVKSNQTMTIPSPLKNKIEHVGWVDYRDIPKYYNDVDIGWNHSNLQTTLKSMFAMPNKFFSYLNNGVPVLTNRSSDRESFIKTHHCGLIIDKLDPTADDYANAIFYLYKRRELLKKMSANAREAMEKYYSWEKMEERLFSVYKRLLSTGTQYMM